MIATFLTEKEANDYSTKIHECLSANCPGYNATAWQTPVSNKAVDRWYIQIPDEYYKQLYKDSEKIIVATKAEFQKYSELKEKLDPLLWSKDEVKK